jgi:hypothetical protein
MDWSVIGLAILIPITAVLIGLALRDGHRRKQEPETPAAYRDELGRRNLPPNVPHFTIGTLQAQINSLKIALDEHLEMHRSWDKDEDTINAFLSGPEFDELRRAILAGDYEPKQQNH